MTSFPPSPRGRVVSVLLTLGSNALLPKEAYVMRLALCADDGRDYGGSDRDVDAVGRAIVRDLINATSEESMIDLGTCTCIMLCCCGVFTVLVVVYAGAWGCGCCCGARDS